MIDDAKLLEIHRTGQGGAVQKAKLYNEHVALLLDAMAIMGDALNVLKTDPRRMTKLEEAAKIDPNHLQRLLALERAVIDAGYCGMPTAG